MTCPDCGAPAGTGEDCAECQIARVGAIQVGGRVTVTLPDDVALWYDEEAYGATWEATIIAINGDSLDVTTPTGDIEPVDAEFCAPLATRAPEE